MQKQVFLDLGHKFIKKVDVCVVLLIRQDNFKFLWKLTVISAVDQVLCEFSGNN